MKTLAVNSYAKLNLFLEVVNKRRDNYHNLRTVFERIGLCDKIILRARTDKKIRVICRGNYRIPVGKTNLAYRSAELLQRNLGVAAGVDIKIIKHIPVASGMGGGSSNAASVLLGLNKLWGLKLNRKKLVDLAQRIGSDVPFFLYNSRFALGSGRGDKIRPLNSLNALRFRHIIIVPKIRISTPSIYRRWDAIHKTFKLTRSVPDVKIFLHRLKQNNPVVLGGSLFNSLEEISMRLYPRIRRIKERLVSFGLKTILMSGSGPALFGIVSSRKEAISLAKHIRRENRSWQVFVTETV